MSEHPPRKKIVPESQIEITAPETSFNPGAASREAHKTFLELKQEMYGAGVWPSEVSHVSKGRSVAEATVLLSDIDREIQSYRDGGLSEEEKKELERKIKDNIELLKTQARESIRADVGTAIDSNRPSPFPNAEPTPHSSRAETRAEAKAELRDLVQKVEATVSPVSAPNYTTANTRYSHSFTPYTPEKEPELEPEPKKEPVSFSMSVPEEKVRHNWSSNSYIDRPATPFLDEEKLVRKTPLNFTEHAVTDEDQEALTDKILKDPELLSAKLQDLARGTRGAEAAKLFAFRPGVTDKETFLKLGASALAMLEAERIYLEEYKGFKLSQNSFGSIADKFLDKDLLMPKDLRDKRNKWVKARGEYLSTMRGSLSDRLSEIDNPNRRDALESKYESHIGGSILEAAVFGAERAEQRTRLEGLENRTKNAFEKAYDAYQKIPSFIRIPGTFGLLALGGALAGGGVTAGWAALAFTGAAAVIRGGLTSAAEHAHNPKLKKVLQVFMDLTSPGTLGKFIAQGGVRAIGAALVQPKAEKELTKTSVFRKYGSDTKQNEKILYRRKTALTADENLERAENAAGVVGAVAGGFAFGSFFKSIFGGEAEAATAHAPTHAAASTAAVGPLTGREFPEGSITFHQESNGIDANNLQHAETLKDYVKENVEKLAEKQHHIGAHHGAVAHPNHHGHSSRADAHHEDVVASEASSAGDSVDHEALTHVISQYEVEHHGLVPETDEHMQMVLDAVHEHQSEAPVVHEAQPAHTEAPVAHETPATPEHAESFVNPHGFDLSKPSIGMVNGAHFAHAATPVEASALANTYALEHPHTPVYIVDERVAESGGTENYVRGFVYDPENSESVAPVSHINKLPPLPNAADYQPLTSK